MSPGIVTGLLFAVTVGLVVADPSPVRIGCTTLCGCLFLICLVRHLKED